ncbi:LysR family transcriptional regulator (plasmid) [Burkholderia sp. SFA1]|nr:LysR family transcriptional regulator [Burkholderia sp. SFA1]
MELEQLRHFVEVVERGSFTRAASFLGVNQPLLSRQIRRLETEMRTVLLVRTGRGVRPTDAGARLLATARNILQQLEAVTNNVSDVDGELRGRVVIGMPPSLGRVLTVPFIRAFAARFPNAQTVMVEGLSRTLYDSLLNDKIDIVLLHDRKPAPSIEVEVIASEPLCLISPRDGRLAAPAAVPFEDIGSLPLIFPCAPNPIRRTVEEAAALRGIALDIRYEIDGIDAILQLVLEGFGSAIAGATIIAKTRYADLLPVSRIVEPELTTQIALAQSVSRQASRLRSRAAHLIRETVQEILADAPVVENAEAR